MTAHPMNKGSDAPHRDEFMAGYLIAVANLMNLHDQPTIAIDVLRQVNVNRNILKGMGFCEYDLKPLRALFSEIERNDRFDREFRKRQASRALTKVAE